MLDSIIYKVDKNMAFALIIIKSFPFLITYFQMLNKESYSFFLGIHFCSVTCLNL
jgi:hypothetical protein